MESRPITGEEATPISGDETTRVTQYLLAIPLSLLDLSLVGPLKIVKLRRQGLQFLATFLVHFEKGSITSAHIGIGDAFQFRRRYVVGRGWFWSHGHTLKISPTLAWNRIGLRSFSMNTTLASDIRRHNSVSSWSRAIRSV